jgi:nicotinate-nucleotide adenylyltransferase
MIDGALGERIAARDLKPPIATPGLKIGLFGGSFNPPHAGHAHVIETALERLALDRLWVMVTPGNPLKDRRVLAPLAERINAARALVTDPRVEVTAFEAAWPIRYSWQTVKRLTAAHPRTRFVWIMGADNLAGFHRWQHWRRIASAMPIAIIDRPGGTLSAVVNPAAVALRDARRPERADHHLALAAPPAWTFIHAKRLPHSSSAIRAGKVG